MTIKVTSSHKMDKKPAKGEYLETLLRSPKTIFSTKDVALLWGENDKSTITNRLRKYVQAGKLIRVHRGFYAKDSNYDRWELATRIYTPSYISFETVLTREGVNFQFYGNIFVASYLKREIKVDDQKIQFVRIKDYVLSNSMGVEHKDGYAIATRERAFLDRMYVSKDYHFDNVTNLNWDKVFEILPIYKNKRLQKKVNEYFHQIKK
jgi:predicted transcriptional regulator of viral defense system